MLAVRQKRRIYDITNVLEGIGLYVRYLYIQAFFRFPSEPYSSFFHCTPMKFVVITLLAVGLHARVVVISLLVLVLLCSFPSLFVFVPDWSFLIDVRCTVFRLIYVCKRLLHDERIEKNSKNMIRWKGDGPRSNSVEIARKLEGIRRELSELEMEEGQLDEHTSSIEKSLKGLVEQSRQNADLAYVTSADLKSMPNFENQTLIALKAPSKSQLVVPDTSAEQGGTDRYTMYLRSKSGPIDAMLVCDAPGENGSAGAADDAAGAGAGAGAGAQSPDDDPMSSAMLLQLLRSSPSKRSIDRVNTKRLRTDKTGTLVRLSPPPLASDYVYNLEDNEGIADLYPIDAFDVAAAAAAKV